MTPEEKSLKVLGQAYWLPDESVDGWTVRKRSDGYCELSRDYTYATIEPSTNGSITSATAIPPSLPSGITPTLWNAVMGAATGGTGWVTTINTPIVVMGFTNTNKRTNVRINFFVEGRWK